MFLIKRYYDSHLVNVPSGGHTISFPSPLFALTPQGLRRYWCGKMSLTNTALNSMEFRRKIPAFGKSAAIQNFYICLIIPKNSSTSNTKEKNCFSMISTMLLLRHDKATRNGGCTSRATGRNYGDKPIHFQCNCCRENPSAMLPHLVTKCRWIHEASMCTTHRKKGRCLIPRAVDVAMVDRWRRHSSCRAWRQISAWIPFCKHGNMVGFMARQNPSKGLRRW